MEAPALVSNELLHRTMLEIGKDVKELKASKVDATIHEKDLQILRLEIRPIAENVAVIKGYIKYVAFTMISGIIVTTLSIITESIII